MLLHLLLKQFQYVFFPITLQTDAPGPGSYIGHVKVDNTSVSFSKKGTGGFASKVFWLRHSLTF